MWKRLVMIPAGIFVLLFVCSVLIFNSEILRADGAGFLKTFILLTRPPADLYEPLAMKDVSFLDGKLKTVVMFQHKYPGKHQLGLLFDELGGDWYQRSRSLNWETSVSCVVGGKSFYLASSYDVHPFIAKHGKGFSLVTYDVPSILPIDKEVNCEISITGLTWSILDGSSSARLFVQKLSDL